MAYEFEFARDALTKATYAALDMHGIEWRAACVAPATYEEALASFAQGGIVRVWDGASEETIYRRPVDNFAARAWHDWRHVTGGHGFTMAGEVATCEAQARDLGFLVGSGTLTANEAGAAWALLRLEVIGQAQHFAERGEFPADQLAWTIEQWGRLQAFTKS